MKYIHSLRGEDEDRFGSGLGRYPHRLRAGSAFSQPQRPARTICSVASACATAPGAGRLRQGEVARSGAHCGGERRPCIRFGDSRDQATHPQPALHGCSFLVATGQPVRRNLRSRANHGCAMLRWFWTGSDIGHDVPCRAQRCSEPSMQAAPGAMMTRLARTGKEARTPDDCRLGTCRIVGDLVTQCMRRYP
jgi:hypothetical protein